MEESAASSSFKKAKDVNRHSYVRCTERDALVIIFHLPKNNSKIFSASQV